MMRFGGHGLFSLLLFLVCGALIGGIIGQVLSQVSLSGMIPYLTKTYEIFDFKDIYLNLAVIVFSGYFWQLGYIKDFNEFIVITRSILCYFGRSKEGL